MAALRAGTAAFEVTPASANINFTIPSGTKPGDTIYIWCTAGFGSQTWTAPSFTAQTAATGTNGSCQLLTYSYLGTEGWTPGTTTVTVTMSASHVWGGYIFASPGVPDPGISSSGQVNAASTTIAISGVTTANTGDLFVVLMFNTGSAGAGGAPGTITPPAGFTAIGTGAKTTGSGATTNTGILIAQTSILASGASGSQNAGAAASTTNGGLLIALSGDTAVQQSFEGITPAGTAISTANSGTPPDTAFDVVGAGATTPVSATGAAHGSLCLSVNATSAVNAFAQYTSAGAFGPQAQAYFRFYANISANPGTAVRLFNMTTGGGSLISVFLGTNGKMSVTYSSAGTSFVNFTAAVPTNSWFRVEGFVLVSATAGQVSASMFSASMDGLTPDETHTSAATLAVGTLSGTTTYSLGDSSAVTMTSAILFDDWALDSTGPIGPVSGGALARHPKWMEIRFPLSADDEEDEFFGAFVL